MALFRFIAKDGETQPIDFGRFMMVTISKGILTKRPDNGMPVNITIKYTPMSDSLYGPQTTTEKSEILATFQPGQNEAEIENMYYDTMNPKISVPPGVEIRLEGNYTSPEEFADKDDDESESSIETPDDEEDGDFQEEEM